MKHNAETHPRFPATIPDWIFPALLLVFCCVCPSANAQALTASNLAEITFDQKLRAQVSRDLRFRDENGKEVRLGDYFGRKPIVLMLGYYQCPMLCTLTLNGMVQGMGEMKWTIGSEFEVINLSIDPAETPALALAKKKNYLKRYGRSGADAGWHFLTGGDDAIRQVASEVGFHYAYDPASKQFAHPSGLIILTPRGNVSHYHFGVTFEGKDMLASLQNAAAEKTGSPIQRLVLLCFHYIPITGKYGAIVMLIVRLLGASTVLVLIAFIVVSLRRDKKRQAAASMAPAAILSATPTGERPDHSP